MRQEFSEKVKVAAFERARGRCERCTALLAGSNRPQYDHSTPDAVDGPPTLANCVVLCRNCHGRKTSEKDVPEIAKTKRIRAKHANAAGKPRGGFRGWRAFNGEIRYARDR
jgi:5-methylcytosine-specific restriction endonuclease McrA